MKQLILTQLNQFSVVDIERFIIPGGPGGRTIWGPIIQLNILPQSGTDERVFIKFAI